MLRIRARGLVVLAAAIFTAFPTSAQAPPDPAPPPPAATPVPTPAAPSDPAKGLDVTGEAPDPTQTLRAEAMTLFGRLDDDRAAVWVASGGGPDARRIVSCPNLFARLEVWTYLSHRLLGPNTRMLFFPEPGTGISRYWTVIDGESVLLAAKSQADKPLDALAESAFVDVRQRTDLVDEIVVYMAPVVLGSAARSLFNLPPLSRMCDRCEFEWRDVARIGDDLRLTLRPKKRGGE